MAGELVSSSSLQGRIICNGSAAAPVILLEEPLSFWGGYEPQTGRIVDQHHPQAGETVMGRIMVLPESRGSAGTPAGIAESIRLGTGPVGIVAMKPDINIVAGLVTASRLYQREIPFLTVSPNDYENLRNVSALEISTGGCITLKSLKF